MEILPLHLPLKEKMEEMIQDQEVPQAKVVPEVAVPLSTMVTGGDWLEVILRLVREQEMDLVVTGTHGRKGVRGFFVGSVSEQLVARADCSVLVVKPHGFPYLRD